ncbi:DUF4129 domain-containing protein [Streptomyces kaniharaensis]|uniref:DUF4129 domain-containing protein n=1 Tax=Streptomyces kaniharaensis TaxID=212423 RepID=A0A6N7KYF0_9ACTN|nr:DUF4129 domain-containing protein [Streptomyces kaniharaensis]MQS15825.1 DUF4129 domain-containing protein [Streptomyces kaniharaensis]
MPLCTGRRGGRAVGVLLVVVGLVAAAVALRSDGGLLGRASAGPVTTIGLVVLLGLGWAVLVGRFAVRFREEVRTLDGPTPQAERLREAAALLLPLAAGAVPVLMLVFHSRVGAGLTLPHPVPLPSLSPKPQPAAHAPWPQVPVEAGGLLGGMFAALLGVLALAAVALAVTLLALLRRRRAGRPAAPAPLAAAPTRQEEVLAEAVASGRRALEGGDARAAVIACYAAMEGSLAASGVARKASESPTELLERALADRRVDAVPARKLTALFREARYSTHELDENHVRRARAALDEIAAGLADAADVTGVGDER